MAGTTPAAAARKSSKGRTRGPAKVATPLRRRGPQLPVSPPTSPAPPRLPGQPGTPVTSVRRVEGPTFGLNANAREEAPFALRRGDIVTARVDFVSSTLAGVSVRRGWRGRVLRLDAVGDALVTFDGQAMLLWVSRKDFSLLAREAAPPRGPPAERDVEEVAVGSPGPASVERKAAASPGPAIAERQASTPDIPRIQRARGFPVWLHVYDLGQVSRLMLNSWAARAGGPGGAFHTGLEVLGVEFSFQAISSCQDEDVSGVTWHTPKSHPRHVYRESVWLGLTPLSVAEVGKALERLERAWLARDYHCLRNNCTDFAETLASELRVPESFPSWAHGVAKSPLLAAAGGCCAPLAARAPGAQLLLARSCSTWSSLEPRCGHDVEEEMGMGQADGSRAI